MFHTDDLIDLSSVASSSALVTSSPASLASSSAPVAVQLRGKYPVQNFHGPFVDANPACSHHHKYTSYEPGLWPCEGCGINSFTKATIRLSCTPKDHLPQCDFSLCQRCQHIVAQQHTKSRPNKKDRLALNAAQHTALQEKLFHVNDRVVQNIISEIRRGLEPLEDGRDAARAAVTAGELPITSTQDFLDFTRSLKSFAREVHDMADSLEKSGMEELNTFMAKQALEKRKGRFGMKQ